MAEEQRGRRRRAKRFEDQLVASSSYGACIVALAKRRGFKPAAWLAEEIRAAGGRCTDRHANRIINGERRVTAVALHVLNAAVLD